MRLLYRSWVFLMQVVSAAVEHRKYGGFLGVAKHKLYTMGPVLVLGGTAFCVIVYRLLDFHWDWGEGNTEGI